MWFSAKLRRKLASHSYWKCLGTHWLNRMWWLRQIKMIILYCCVKKGSNESPECTRKIVSYFSGMERLFCVCVTALVRHLSRRTCSVLLSIPKRMLEKQRGKKTHTDFWRAAYWTLSLVCSSCQEKKEGWKVTWLQRPSTSPGRKCQLLKGSLIYWGKKRSKTHWLGDEAGQIRSGDEIWIPTEREVNQGTVMDVKCGCPIPCCLQIKTKYSFEKERCFYQADVLSCCYSGSWIQMCETCRAQKVRLLDQTATPFSQSSAEPGIAFAFVQSNEPCCKNVISKR